jgi:hypothetical protein
LVNPWDTKDIPTPVHCITPMLTMILPTPARTIYSAIVLMENALPQQFEVQRLL